jgi:hypothetical protein
MGNRLTLEECARRILERELGRPVILHDDGSRSRMYDLRVGSVERPESAIECIGAVDPQRTETWNEGPGRGCFTLAIEGDWHVVLQPDTRVKRIRAELPSLLREFSRTGLVGFTPVDAFLQISHPRLFQRLSRLKIDSVGRYEPGTGRVSLGMTGYGGAVDPTGSEVPQWIGDFLRAEDRRDVLIKLASSNAEERHVFVGVSFGGAPWLVESYLGTESDIVPEATPDLPAPVDAVWIMHSKKGLRWDGTVWRFFNAVVPASSS